MKRLDYLAQEWAAAQEKAEEAEKALEAARTAARLASESAAAHRTRFFAEADNRAKKQGVDTSRWF